MGFPFIGIEIQLRNQTKATFPKFQSSVDSRHKSDVFKLKHIDVDIASK